MDPMNDNPSTPSPRVVLDANVFVSALLKPHRIPAAIVRLIIMGNVVLAYDARILSDYREVARRPKFHFDPSRAEAVLNVFLHDGISILAPP